MSSFIHRMNGRRNNTNEPTEMSAEEENLEPERPGEIERMKEPDRDRRDAEEDHVEPSRRRHFERDEDQADDDPVPPGHSGMAGHSN